MEDGVKILIGTLIAATLAAWPARAGWQAVETIATYTITGTSGPELYASIGKRGPTLGEGRVIAHTGFKLTWTRSYEPTPDGGCRLAAAKPRLVITYTLPRPARPLLPATAALWKTFIDGVEAHERVHGEQIKEMVRRIEAATVGFSVPDDPRCQRIREALPAILGPLSQAQRAAARDFDRVEMSDGGAVHRLILSLVNGR
ncbi:DUF922 domain-containing Zn-dependent protease [Ensifer soli]|uniref:DUF922 domain-containing Zn-dependent protease n=1 Tax=Ciceribacter sp. sgz301302 TaxID=3342379 RepID=UPI0035BB32DB